MLNPERPIVGGAQTVLRVEGCNRCVVWSDPPGRIALDLTGSESTARMKGSPRNLGWSLDASENEKRQRRGQLSQLGIERSERAVRAMTLGNPLQGTQLSKGARQENRLVGGRR